MKKIFFLCLLAVLVTVLLAGCGGEDIPATEAPETGCPHGTSVERSDTYAKATCANPGFHDYTCALCGEEIHEVFPAGHIYEFGEEDFSGLGYIKCSRCGDTYFPVDPEESISFYSTCSGNITAKINRAPEEFGVKIDGEDYDVTTLYKDKVKFAEDLERGYHSFVLTNHSDKELQIRDLDLGGSKRGSGADVILETWLPMSGVRNSGFSVYVRTSDPSEKYYIRYGFYYEESAVLNEYASNTSTNRSNYRIHSAELVRMVRADTTGVVCSVITDTISQGEISLAIKQANVDPETLSEECITFLNGGSTGYAKDFIGGFHGDEHLKEFHLYADGEEVSLVGNTARKFYLCSHVTFEETTTLTAWGTSGTDATGKRTRGREVAEHSQSFIIDSAGVHDLQTVKWLVDDFTMDPSNTYLQMFTLRRVNGVRKICEGFRIFDESGNQTGKMVVSEAVKADAELFKNASNRRVEYFSETSGYSAEAGFRVVDNSVAVSTAFIMTRATGVQDDNKWYASFRSVENGNTPKAGETWKVENFYTVNYVEPQR